MRQYFVFAVMLSITVGLGRGARACPPTVRLSGDEALVAEVTPVLVERGIALDEGGCPALVITLVKRGQTIVVSDASGVGPASAREVTDVRTAATVIESWVRTDVEAPLLEPRPSRDAEPPGGASTVVAAAPPVRGRGLQVFAAGEAAVASDHSDWLGFELGACLMLGRACAGARARFSAVADGPGPWERAVDRQLVEALVGLDLPLRLGRATLWPGLALGAGRGQTHEESAEGNQEGDQVTIGLRGELHLSLSVAVSRSLAAETNLSVEATQTVRTESTSREPLPGDARLLAYAGVGLRFGGP
ncbi:MAG TPA: hypothetical protein VMT47_15130 [Polyangia bacterium]|nr:hypothetical protein [Polyangia bacterium]